VALRFQGGGMLAEFHGEKGIDGLGALGYFHVGCPV